MNLDYGTGLPSQQPGRSSDAVFIRVGGDGLEIPSPGFLDVWQGKDLEIGFPYVWQLKDLRGHFSGLSEGLADL
jgi:hypothetical protein